MEPEKEKQTEQSLWRSNRERPKTTDAAGVGDELNIVDWPTF